jgi:hypothetical protein
LSFEDHLAIAAESESNAEMSSEPEQMDFKSMPMPMAYFKVMPITDIESDESMEDVEYQESPVEFSFDEQSEIATELESDEEFSFDDEQSEMNCESEEMSFEAMSMPIANTDSESEMSFESEEMDFETMSMSMADTNFDDLKAESAAEQFSSEFSFDEQSAIAFETFETDDSINEFSFNEQSEISSESDEFMGEFIDEDDAAKEISLDSISPMSSEPNEFSFEATNYTAENVLEDLGLNEEAAIADEPDEFMQELVDDNEQALNELTFEPEFESEMEDLAIADNSESDEFMAAFNDADESSQESSFEETSTDDSDFNKLMGAFSDDNQSSDEVLNVDSDVFDLEFEDDEDDYGVDELDSLDIIDKKLDELTEISDDSLGELNDLLGSIQDNTSSKQEEFNEVNRDK